MEQFRLTSRKMPILDTYPKESRISVYFPKDCPNTCPFCTSREDYKKWGTNPFKVMDFLASLPTDMKHIVTITGGEPASDINMLRDMIHVLPPTADVYINTTALTNTFDRLKELVGEESRVQGIAVSRHGANIADDRMILHGIVDDDAFKDVPCGIRINAVVPDVFDSDYFRNIMERWRPIFCNRPNVYKTGLTFRFDYNKCNFGNLHLLDTPEIKALMAVPDVQYAGQSISDYAHTMLYNYRGMRIRYHRCLPGVVVKIGDIVSLRELVIYPDGFVATDWDRTNVGLDWYMSNVFHNGEE